MAQKSSKKAIAAKGNKNAKKPVAKKPVKKTIAAKSVAKKVVKAAKKPVVKAAVKAKAKPAAKKPVKAAAKKVVKAPAKVAAKPVAVKPAAKAVVQAAKPAAPAKKPESASGKPVYKVGVHVVYPTHGVGKIIAEETQMIGDHELRMLVIAFEKDKMTLRVPVHRAAAAGLRLVSTAEQMKKVFVSLKGRARTSRGMWSRRAQEYEAKINSGNIFSIAEVVRDLHQNVDQSERSYSERMIYESALNRLVGEL
ncbi:MAG: CarD family transcriptional regulator, partial [Proteobacteria bacterium]|nr:CarD family transcriptional regulator [Pseudomonadota bacterium]